MSVEKSLKLLELYPNSKYADDARLLLGKCYYYQKQYFRAREYLHQLIHYQPNSELLPQANLWIIKTDIADKKYDNAELQINELLKQKLPNNIKAEIFLLQANLYRRNKNYQQAVDYYNKCTEINKKLRPEAYFAIGMIYDSLNNYQQSALYYKKVIKLNPDKPYDFESRLKYGIALKKQNEIDLALNNFYDLSRKEVEEKQKAEINLQIADCLMRQGNIETAFLEYGDIIKNFPKTAEAAIAYYKLGKFFEERMKYKRALQNYLQVKSEYSQSKHIDSSQTRQQALFKLLALREMISVGLQDSSESREISNKIIFSEQNISNFRDDTTTVSLVKHDSVETVETDENMDEDEESDDNNQQNESENISSLPENQSFQDRENLNDKEESKPKEVVNPEISKLDVKKLDKNLFLLGEIFMLSFNHPDSALANYKFIINNLPESEYVPKAYFNSAYIYDTIKNNHPKADSLYNMIVNKFPDTETARRARIKLSIDVRESGGVLGILSGRLIP
ncbi:MAG: tetratricopeptide repeat protein, partial [bacterium]